METIDIVNLIERNPITRLSRTYNNKLLTKIKNGFTEQQQQLFVASFYCYLNYNQTTEFVIDLDNVWRWLGFNQKINAKVSLEKHFIHDKDYKCLLLQPQEQKNGRGGHNKETILMTIQTFKLFCIKAATKKSEEIHEYFIKLEQILQETVHEETDELRQQLEDQKEKYEKKIKNTKEQEKHNLLLREFASIGEIVYIIRVKTYENGSYIVKIGESRRGIEARYKEHRSNYEEAVILDCFSVKKSRDFENFIHNHEKIKPSRVFNLQNHEKETELFLIGEKLSYNILLQVINDNIKQFNEYSHLDFEKLKAEKEMLEEKLMKVKSKSLSSTGMENFRELLDYIKKQDERQKEQDKKIEKLLQQNKEIIEKLNNIQLKSETKITTGFGELNKTVGPRLQKINPDTLTVVKVYEYLEEAIKESNNTIKRPSIEKAIKEATIYQGYRWNYISRDVEDPTNITNLQPTKKITTPSVGYIAKLDAEQTHIINVYIDRKTAALENGFSASGLDTPVKNKKPIRGNMYMLFSECEQKLRDDFIEKKCADKPLLLFKDGVGQYDENQNLLQEFSCKYDCINACKMSDKTMARALEKGAAYNGFFYKKLEPRLYI